MNFYHCKPAVSPRSHLLFAALIWTGIGVMLLYKGISRHPHPDWILLFAIVAGSVKSLAVLDRSAVRIIRRISGFSTRVWLLAVYPLKTWLMVAAMMAFGLFLRFSSTPTIVACFVYCSVGWGLLFSGRKIWHAYFTN